jgi:hypothetical protein
LKFRKINKNEIMANEYENSSGIILCFKSYTVIRTRRDIMTIEIATETVKIRGEVSRVLAFFKYTNINRIAVKISTNTYCGDILLLQVLHFPRSTIQLAIGNRSLADSTRLHDEHLDLPPNPFPVLNLYNTTFRKLPIIAPKIKKVMDK